MKKLFSSIVLLLALTVGISLNVKVSKAEGTTTNTKVTGVNVLKEGTNTTYFYLQFMLSEYDYTGAVVQKSDSFYVPISTGTNLASYILTDGTPITLDAARKDRFRAGNKNYQLIASGDPNNLPFKTVTIKVGAKFPAKSYGYDGGAEAWYVTTEDITYEYNGSVFTELKAKTAIDTAVTAIEYAPRTHATRTYDGYFYFFLSSSDYPTSGSDYKAQNLYAKYDSKVREGNLPSKVEIIGKNGTTYKVGADYGSEMMVYADSAHIGAMETRLLSFFTGDSYNEIKEINVPQGTEFPSLAYLTGTTTEQTFYTTKADTKYVLSYTKENGAMVYEPEAVVLAKSSAISEATSHVNKENYRTAEQEAIDTILSNYQTQLKSIMTVREIEESLTRVKNSLDAIKTNAQLTKEENVTRYTSLINEYVNASLYDADNQAIIREKSLAAINAINACAIGECEDIYKAYCAEIDKLETTAQRELREAKAAANTTMESIVDLTLYRENEKATIELIISDTLAAIENATTVEAVNQAIATARTNISLVKTNAELTLEETKADAIETINGYADKNLYRENEKSTIETLILRTTIAIEEATSTDEIANSVQGFKNSIDGLPTDAQLTLEETKLAAETEINGYVNLDDYREEEKGTVATAIRTALSSVEDAKTTEEVETIVTDFKAEVDGIKTNAEYELEERIERTTASIPNYKSADLYREAEQNTLAGLVAEYSSKVAAATSIEEVETLYHEFQDACDALKTATEYEAEEETSKTTTVVPTTTTETITAKTTVDNTTTASGNATDAPAKKGCKNSVFATFGIFGFLTALAFVAKKKREE